MTRKCGDHWIPARPDGTTLLVESNARFSPCNHRFDISHAPSAVNVRHSCQLFVPFKPWLDPSTQLSPLGQLKEGNAMCFPCLHGAPCRLLCLCCGRLSSYSSRMGQLLPPWRISSSLAVSRHAGDMYRSANDRLCSFSTSRRIRPWRLAPVGGVGASAASPAWSGPWRQPAVPTFPWTSRRCRRFAPGHGGVNGTDTARVVDTTSVSHLSSTVPGS